MFENTLYTQHKRRQNEQNKKNEINSIAGPGTNKRIESYQRLAVLHKEYANNSEFLEKVAKGISKASLVGAVSAEIFGMHRSAKVLLGASAMLYAVGVVSGIDEFNHHVSGLEFERAATKEQKAVPVTGLRLVQPVAQINTAM